MFNFTIKIDTTPSVTVSYRVPDTKLARERYARVRALLVKHLDSLIGGADRDTPETRSARNRDFLEVDTDFKTSYTMHPTSGERAFALEVFPMERRAGLADAPVNIVIDVRGASTMLDDIDDNPVMRALRRAIHNLPTEV